MVKLFFATANLKLAEQTLQAQLDSYNLNQKRFNVGIDSEIPLRQAQISVETARNDVANYRTQVAQAQNLLNLLAGQAVPSNLLPTQSVKTITQEKSFSTGLSSDLLQNRPDLKVAEYQLRAAGANIGAAKPVCSQPSHLQAQRDMHRLNSKIYLNPVVLHGQLALA